MIMTFSTRTPTQPLTAKTEPKKKRAGTQKNKATKIKEEQSNVKKKREKKFFFAEEKSNENKRTSQCRSILMLLLHYHVATSYAEEDTCALSRCYLI